HRWVTLVMLALAFLTITAAAEHAQPPPPGMIPLTRNEIAHLAAAVICQPSCDTGYLQRWPAWRRRHQHTARTCHYQRQAADDR
ncbi:MAG TPA: IS701 family transposase, partial [Streptosporangiaceae bacterium]|nr:IS701 family transposase [Streptosporangiaceae bacterium]